MRWGAELLSPRGAAFLSPDTRSTTSWILPPLRTRDWEQLRVVWELEPGRRVIEDANLPDPARGFEEPLRLQALLHAVRWGAISSTDVRALHSPFRSGITLEDYQLDPVARAIQMPRVNLLVADDVGLGKTIEAGLVVQELMLRHRVRSELVVCPASI